MTAREDFQAALQDWTGAFMRNSMRSFLLFSKERGLSVPQIGALFRIHRGDCSVSDLGSELGVTNAAASQMLEGLVKEDLARRSEDPNDRRAKKLMLTEKGRRLLSESIRARQGWLNSLADGLSAPEQAQAAAALRMLVGKIREIEQKEAGDG